MDAVETTTSAIETVTEVAAECPYLVYAGIAVGVALVGYGAYRAYNHFFGKGEVVVEAPVAAVSA